MADPLIEVLDDIVIPRSSEIVIPELRQRSGDEQEFCLVHKGKSPDDSDDRVRRFMGTLETQDRKGDEVALAGWDFAGFKRNPIVLWNHRLTGELTDILGRVTRIKREKIQRKGGDVLEGWAFDVWFLPGPEENAAYHENGERAKAMLDAGVLNACSVTFRPITSKWLDRDDGELRERSQKDERRHDDPGVRWLRKELLEFSLCMVGAHQDALQLAQAKGIAVPEFMSQDFEIVSKPGWDDKDEYTEIRYRVRDPGAFEDASFRRVPVKKDKPKVFAIMGKLKGKSSMTVQSLRFPKEEGWTVEKARSWLKEHEDLTKAHEERDPEQDVIEIPKTFETPARPPREPQEAANPSRSAWLDTVTREAQRATIARNHAPYPSEPISPPEDALAESHEEEPVHEAPPRSAHRSSVQAEMDSAPRRRLPVTRRIVRVVKRSPPRKKVFRVLRQKEQ